ncbi:histidine phosphatase family protein [Pelagibius marinus]|uniref:histidine phosphatase family protein n=1 Tax=Pelagibius marinus TaxID=2762760 RepID=UPI00187299F5|nr:histidine phosphatase family protein [Pelagibius marinus]
MIYLLRHGETEWNRQGRLQGHGDSPLTERGLSQAVAMGGALRRAIDDFSGFTLVASPLGRTLATARCVAAVIGKNPAEIIEEPRLMEHGFGHWEGEIYDEVEDLYPEQWQAREADRWHYRVPGGESYALVAERVGAWLAEQPEDARLIVVSHGLAGKVLRGLYLAATREEVLAMAEPQDAVFRLFQGNVSRFDAAVPEME